MEMKAIVVMLLLAGMVFCKKPNKDEKPGSCPKVGSGDFGICLEACSSDQECKGTDKCCSNGCGHVCTMREIGKKSCKHGDMKYRSGETFYENCYNCICIDGTVVCPTDVNCDEECLVDGNSYKELEDVPSTDKCTGCKCVKEEGVVKIKCKPIIDCDTNECKGKKCKECSIALCLKIEDCGPGYKLETPPRECCQTCVRDCSTVKCQSVADCPKGSISQIPTGECCATCVKDCSAVSCLRPICKLGERSETPEGECCPKCVKDCSLVRCALPPCELGFIAEVPSGECCPVCSKDCKNVKCKNPECKNGLYIKEIPSGECCPKCVLDCTLVLCPLPKCESGEKLGTPKGECCPKCVKDCDHISCPLIKCEVGFEPVVPEGECCPGCVKVPDEQVCPAGCPLFNYPCGRDGKPCPEDHYCKISPTDKFAICCPGCTYDGEVREVGSTFPSTDGCNTCFCDGNLMVPCTKIYCGGCPYNNKRYRYGVRFYDKCNECTCGKDGKVTCTEKKCGDRCETGLKPVEKDTICGGFGGLPCNDPYTAICDFSNVPEGTVDGTGICCSKDKQCPKGSKPSNPCGKLFGCPVGYKCKSDIGVCCSVGCDYNDEVRTIGSSFPSTDGCNTCFCDADLFVTCTEKECLDED